MIQDIRRRQEPCYSAIKSTESVPSLNLTEIMNQHDLSIFNEYPDVLTVEEMQKALGIGRSMAYRLIRDGKIKHLRIGKSIKIPKRFLVDYVFSGCYTGTVAAGYPSP